VNFFTNFTQLFSSVERAGLFDLSDEFRYVFLENVMNSPSVNWLLVIKFHRMSSVNQTEDTSLPTSARNVEDELTRLGILDTETDFLLTTTNGVRSLLPMDKKMKLWLRYTLLGWCPVDLWPKFSNAQKSVEVGKLL